MLSLSELIEPLFVEAGWRRRSMTPPVAESQVEAQFRVSEILGHFGGIQVGKTGPGTEQAASDIHFYSSLRREVGAIASPWLGTAGRCEAFGTAHHDHIVLLVNNEGAYFAFTEPDEHLYSLGLSFGEAMRKLLLGYSYGAPLARDA